MDDSKQAEFKKTDESQEKSECGAACPNCVGGTCFLEMGHPGLHHCTSCGNVWETFRHYISGAD